MRALLRSVLYRTGLRKPAALPTDMDEAAVKIIRAVTPYTMTSAERVFAVIEACRYVEAAVIEGAIVECGTWRGGAMMAAVKALTKPRHFHLFDTFEGMPAPTDSDVDVNGRPASVKFEQYQARGDGWCAASIDEVRSNLLAAGCAADHLHLVKGCVQDTIPASAPERIAILRLDTDWYESTKHELAHLFPRLVAGGVLLLDDYGHWRGSRQAVDEYFAERGARPYLARVDYTGRVMVKDSAAH